MKISDMTDAEKQALGTLVRVMVRADGDFSEDELAGLERTAEELGEEDFWQLLRDSGREAHTEEGVKAQARAVDRKEAQETIYGVLFGVAATGSIVPQEAGVLDWLAAAWNLETGTAPPEDG